MAQQPATVKEYTQSFPTYAFSDPSPLPLLSPVYPYFRYDGFTDKAQQKQWKIVELENDYIKVMITPEIGGKIWAAIEKKSGRSFIYYNHAVKFRDVAMRGPWTSGGLEANYGIIGHTPNCATPVDYTTRVNENGSVSCFIGVLDLLTRTNWRVEINLPKDKAYFTTQSFWYNATPLEQPYYHWMNLGVKAKGNLEFVFPGNKYIGHNGEYADWPVNKANGKKINFYEENNFGGYKSYHVFGTYTHFFGAYYHDEENGMVRYGTYDDKAGKKIWIWGLSRQGMIWEKMLTDTDGQYVEIQSGRLFNQNADKSSLTPFKHIGFAPYATDGWKEYWYPVSQTKGIAEANAYGALNIKNEQGWMKLYFSPVQTIRDTLKVKEGDRVIYSKLITLSPLQLFADSLKVSVNAANVIVTLGDHLLEYNPGPGAGELKRPVDAPANFDWTNAYGLYLQGKEYMDEKMFNKAEVSLKAAIEKDGNFLPALVKMAELQYRNMRYAEALATITHALRINTEAGDANYYYGVINAQLGNTADAKDGFSIATLTPEYRSAAYTGLAGLYIKEKNFTEAIAYTQKATDFNRYNINALMLQAVAYRYQHNTTKAEQAIQTILSFDPLNHFAGFEKYMLHQTKENEQLFISAVRNELPAETFAEMAIWYYSNGFTSEAKTVFALSPASAEATYWLAFLNDQAVDCKIINPNLAFPFRSETAAVLEALLKKQNDWLLKYQLALIYHDRNRLNECKALIQACADGPTYAPFYATRYMMFKDAGETGLVDLQKALSLDPVQWRYHKMLTEYYNSHGQVAKALTVITPYYKAHPDEYIMGMLYAKTLMLNQSYKEADKVLTKLNIIPFEGATDGRTLYREAKLMQAIEQMRKKNYTRALAFIKDARLWPENLGVGKPYDEDIDTRLEDWMQYLCYEKSGKKDGDSLLIRIKNFNPMVDNTVRNFIPSNALVTAWAIEKTDGKEKAEAWINNQQQLFPELKPVFEWSKKMLNNNTTEAAPTIDEDAGSRILHALAVLKS
jgi:tetratricopeptide (TPR) repeat protein